MNERSYFTVKFQVLDVFGHITVFEKGDSYKITEMVVIVVDDIELPTLQNEGSLTIEG